MKLRSFVLACFCAVLMSANANAQMGKIPAAVTTAFSKQYANAGQVSYSDNFSDYSVNFLIDSAQHVAHYNKKGEWKGTEKTITFESLPSDVKDGFMKSKFSDWSVQQVLRLYLAPTSAGEQYRVKVRQGDLKKRYLFFTPQGKLVKDKMTL